MRILHCSDVHLTQDYGQVPFLKLGWRWWMAWYELVLKGRAAAYADAPQTLSAIAGQMGPQAAEHLVISGDLTSSATEDEFRMAREALGTLATDPSRCTVVPGNHDHHHPQALTQKRFEHHFGALLRSDLPQYQHEGVFPLVRLLKDEAAVIALNSALLPAIPGVAYGAVSAAQWDGLESILSDPSLKRRAVLVAIHHAPLTGNGVPDKPSHRLIGGDRLMARLAGPRFAILHGHIHRRYHHPATASRPHLFNAGSSTQKGHQGYWSIEVEAGKITGGTAHNFTAPG